MKTDEQRNTKENCFQVGLAGSSMSMAYALGKLLFGYLGRCAIATVGAF